ncbi:hypothetical protein IU500_19385 [Nocardia terpenica]|uniref:hypothetical protein n=1 Tax=Nocardia terpenica TaxID=455432 RepID=UPI0018963109|nr:hypothetical protein [Nocardia terpenica]MBF6061998.1 hypothetical protein [Nocardia terpenica]MBF6106202.1 hypothetical protein [Nocardia terpenica]MBF6110418.1 hypothetical protein [Nocardia terpenica]MBF6120745.1 hypothetical protein [Nocardia terpenica]MBF6151754.1 hypothetical protein [Nocardia terpenica]
MSITYAAQSMWQAMAEPGALSLPAALAAHRLPVLADGIQNPLDGVSPDLGLFSGALDAAWKRVVAFVWALVVIGSSVRVIIGAFKVKRAKSRGYANDLAEGSEELQDALVSLGLVGLASPIIATVLFVVGGHG